MNFLVGEISLTQKAMHADRSLDISPGAGQVKSRHATKTIAHDCNIIGTLQALRRHPGT